MIPAPGEEWPEKAISADLDYEFTCERWLQPGEVVVAIEWIMPDGLSYHDPEILESGQGAKVWLAGGIPGMRIVRAKVTTNLSRVDVARIPLRVVA